MPTQDELKLAALLVHNELVSKEDMQEILRRHAENEEKGESTRFEDLLLDGELVVPAELNSMKGIPLTETQPIGDYEFLRKIAVGGMAEVYLAVYRPIDERVALKIMKPELARHEHYRLRFLRESKLLMALEHPNIVKGYEIRRDEGYVFCAMEHVDGRTVEELIDDDGPVDERKALFVVREVAKALTYLDSRGVVHRDLKPGNILLTEGGEVKIIDLGLAKLRKGMVRDSAEGVTVGTVEYLSPEQARGRGDVDIRSDIYSLGVTLFHMIVGDVPFKGESNAEVIAKQVLQALNSPVLKSRHVSPHTHYLIQRMMSKEREDRFQQPDDVIAEIEQKAGDVSDVVNRPVLQPLPSSTKVKKPPRQPGPGRGGKKIVAPRRTIDRRRGRSKRPPDEGRGRRRR